MSADELTSATGVHTQLAPQRPWGAGGGAARRPGPARRSDRTPGLWWQQPTWAPEAPAAKKPKPMHRPWSDAWNGAAMLVMFGVLIAAGIIGYTAFFTSMFI